MKNISPEQPRKTRTRGPLDARIMVVGEAPGAEEERQGIPFVGPAGIENDRMLMEAGIDPNKVFFTNVCKYRPPNNDIGEFFLDARQTRPGPEIIEGIEELKEEIARCNPKVIIAYGNTALWALTGNRGITTWRGSYLPYGDTPIWVVPTYHPAAILRMWAWRAIAVHDLRRAARAAEHGVAIPPWRFEIAPSLEAATSRLQSLLSEADASPLYLAVDLETRGGQIACIGLAWNELNAICIPFIDVKRPDFSYWLKQDEFSIILLLRKLLCHPNLRIIGQNFLYDLQYLAKQWGIAPPVHFDTMVAHHMCWPGTPKGLDYLSSMYCTFHQYWKDDGKDFDPFKHDENRLWVYNCRDAVATFEVWKALDSALTQLNRREPFNFQMYELYPVVLGMMLRGVHVDLALRGQLAMEISEHIAERQSLINFFARRPLNARSPKQLREIFYDEFGQRPVLSRKTGNPTTDEEALNEIARREPLLRRLCGAINEIRALNSAMNVVRVPLDSDGMLRTSYNIAGPETFRFSSSENAFGSGTNLQNITSGRVSEYTGLRLPNLRRLIIPPYGHSIVEIDLERADLQVVVWEANDPDLKAKLRAGVDMHTENARDIYGTTRISHHQRQVAKTFVHATNYGGRARTVATTCGLTVHETENMQRRWFQAHPGIKEWHRRIESELYSSRSVKNAFGYVRFYFERIEECLTEALAWIPQSTVAIVINRIMVNLNREHRSLIRLLLQVHDSTVFSTPTETLHSTLRAIYPSTRVTVPYDDPLIIPVSFKASDRSWGDCEPIELS